MEPTATMPPSADAPAPAPAPSPARTRAKNLSSQFSGMQLTRYRLLFNAARGGDLPLVRELLASGMDVNLAGPRGATPLHIAARFGQKQMVELLLAHGADREKRDDRGSTPSDKARSLGMSHIAHKLADPTPHHLDPHCRRFLEAAHRSDLAKLSQMAAADPQLVYKRGPRGASAMHVAARYGHVEAVALLLKLGASPYATDDSGYTPIDKARQLKHKEALQLLLDWEEEGNAGIRSHSSSTDMLEVMHEDAPSATGAEPFSGGVANGDRAKDAAKAEEATRAATRAAARAASAAAQSPPPEGEGSGGAKKLDAEKEEEEEELQLVGEMQTGGGVTRSGLATPLGASLPEEDVGVVLLPMDNCAGMLERLPEVPPRPEGHSLWLMGVGRSQAYCAGVIEARHTATAALRIGRAPSCELRLNDPEVSGQHAALWWDGGALLVADRGSFNGTFLRLSPEKEPSTWYGVAVGDVFAMGDHALTLEVAGGAASLRIQNLKTPHAPPARHELREDKPTSLGRAPSNDVCLPDQSVSAMHAEMEAKEGSWRLRDLGSSNGTSFRLSPERTESRAFPLSIGHTLAFGAGSKCSELCVTRFRLGVAERKGRRASMEDAHVAIDAMPPPPGWEGRWPLLSFYAVYDGHGGAEASDYCRTHLHKRLLLLLSETLRARTPPRDDPPSALELSAALRAAFLAVDEAFLHATPHSSGTTAVAALVSESHVVVANTGDSRAYLHRDGAVLRLSLDHKPDRVDEEARISRAGGWVSQGRVMHTLAVSRAIGDRDFKMLSFADGSLPFRESLVIAEPEIRVARLADGDELLLACDGLWDVLTPEQSFDFLHTHGGASNPEKAVQLLAQAAEEEYSSLDNITALYARLSLPT
ncbi:hypothetical protein AB1Y20_013578 [Prymnesium parvum]|uniref:Protein-serine/threonine phosphatase n=1 Tax=Prymnesium parvum TaxID=97485 RepID=A0AB34IIZ4_PRYPA